MCVYICVCVYIWSLSKLVKLNTVIESLFGWTSKRLCKYMCVNVWLIATVRFSSACCFSMTAERKLKHRYYCNPEDLRVWLWCDRCRWRNLSLIPANTSECKNTLESIQLRRGVKMCCDLPMSRAYSFSSTLRYRKLRCRNLLLLHDLQLQ